MARKKEFDQDVILDRALDLFWELGYEFTSIQDLVERLGIGRGSLYNAFGDKHTLFLMALNRYLDNGLARIKRDLESVPPREAIPSFFNKIVEETIADPLRRGCFYVNMTAEIASRDSEVAEILASHRADVVKVFEKAVMKAQEAGASPDLNPKAAAEFFYNTLLGLRVSAKCAPDRASLDRIVSLATSLLN
ncbi:TetR/AcrR family transcriptional regulator [Halodesulfovibrio marinisediminis]|uniref:Transcriptional regulator, TetR family n=1 Tax=Halodesulfovibrio marinisediminis DSM 17456 TaxID=1121457 RepID=A0A1N6E9Y1_9BACT|nr:TetR/AcrR family transcriptional regulator [Halodesulfovibrio marinisediminis]SIN79812.1 transcriptional regulator, TetR family [Halodesulfovibrio marinisediminis DSM 17456]